MTDVVVEKLEESAKEIDAIGTQKSLADEVSDEIASKLKKGVAQSVT